MTRLYTQPNVEPPRLQSQFASAAARYARNGWHVFPIRPGTRQAYLSIKHHGTRWGSSAAPDVVAELWRRFPDADIGVDVALSGFFVLDVDTMRGHGRNGGASLHALEIRHGALPLTRTVITPTDGLQFLFRHPGRGRTIRNSASKIGNGLDIVGDGGMFIAPPSRGRAWQWQVDIAISKQWLLDQVCDIPRALARLGPRSATLPQEPRGLASPELLAMMRADAGRGVSTDAADVREPEDVETKIAAALTVIPADLDYSDWFRAGCAIHAGLGDAGFALFDDWSRDAPHKYPKEGCAGKWRECAKARAIRVETLYWMADQYDRGWRDVYARLLRNGAVS